jgi:hypothetical protein
MVTMTDAGQGIWAVQILGLWVANTLFSNAHPTHCGGLFVDYRE